MTPVELAATLAVAVVAASILSVELGISVALLESCRSSRWFRRWRAASSPATRPSRPLLMSAGLTFGTISALYGLRAHIITRTQFSLLVTVVVLSAIVPTAIAQRWFSPNIEEEGELECATRPGA